MTWRQAIEIYLALPIVALMIVCVAWYLLPTRLVSDLFLLVLSRGKYWSIRRQWHDAHDRGYMRNWTGEEKLRYFKHLLAK